jgi:hypothetical protein
MLFREIIAVHTGNQTEPINTLHDQNAHGTAYASLQTVMTMLQIVQMLENSAKLSENCYNSKGPV